MSGVAETSVMINKENRRTFPITSRELPKRIWVKTPTGLATSIMTTEADIVDDLKTAVCRKYPNTIASVYDASEIKILVKRQSERDQIQSRKYSKTKINYSKNKSEHMNENKQRSDKNTISMSYFTLEPDKGVWDVLDELYGGEMKMSDAFLIEMNSASTLDTSSTRHYDCQSSFKNLSRASQMSRSSSPSHFDEQGHCTMGTTLYSPKPHRPLADLKGWDTDKSLPESPNIYPDQSSSSLSHKRLQISPSHTPISSLHKNSSNSQAVLLLPKNFSLGERRSSRILSSNDRDDISSLKGENDDMTKDSTGFSANKFVPDSELLQTPQIPVTRKNNLELSIDSVTLERDIPELGTHNQKEPLNQNDASKYNRKLRDNSGRTLNTSTFEQVLPSISVLVVEDNSINQAILGAFLRKHKIHYQIAKNGQEAVDKWRNGGFHLVLMDIQLPVKSGIEATKEIRLLERINRIGVFAQHELTLSLATGLPKIKEEDKLDLTVFRSPVIIVALTASSNSSVDKKNALTAGCNDFLTKPVNLVWLQNKITEWGCMQALIDFDGWRCKGSAGMSVSSKIICSS